MRYPELALLLIIGSSSAASVLAEEHRQHGVHEHGGGQLNIALEKNTLMIELSLPAMNVVGFEHPYNNEQQHKQVTDAVANLRDGLRLFSPSKAANCNLSKVEVETALLDTSGHAEEHADFDASYEFNCSHPAQLKALELSLFQQFPGTQQLEVQLITAEHQTGKELHAENPVIRLD